MLGIAKDEGDSLREAVAAGLDADALVTTAGVSMGDRDMVRAILSEYKVEELFWKIDIKPGRPTAFATAEGVPVFSLPGNPVSAMITFEFLVRPALLRMKGLQNVFKLPVKARLAQAVKKKVGRTFLMRVRLESDSEGLLARNPGDQNTGILTTLVNADGIAVLPAEQDSFQAGETVDVVMMGLVGKPS